MTEPKPRPAVPSHTRSLPRSRLVCDRRATSTLELNLSVEEQVRLPSRPTPFPPPRRWPLSSPPLACAHAHPLADSAPSLQHVTTSTLTPGCFVSNIATQVRVRARRLRRTNAKGGCCAKLWMELLAGSPYYKNCSCHVRSGRPSHELKAALERIAELEKELGKARAHSESARGARRGRGRATQLRTLCVLRERQFTGLLAFLALFSSWLVLWNHASQALSLEGRAPLVGAEATPYKRALWCFHCHLARYPLELPWTTAPLKACPLASYQFTGPAPFPKSLSILLRGLKAHRVLCVAKRRRTRCCGCATSRRSRSRCPSTASASTRPPSRRATRCGH
eukprot:164611-Pleurochrysis_carterae.AAC.2